MLARCDSSQSMPDVTVEFLKWIDLQVLQAIAKALDDPKRAVRQEAVKCRQAW